MSNEVKDELLNSETATITTKVLVPVVACKATQKVQVGSCRCLLSGAEITLLTLLIEAQGEVLSKGDLLSKGWSGRIVSQSSLPVAIKHIRDALKNSGHSDVLHTAKNGGGYFIEKGLFRVDLGEIPSTGTMVDNNKPARSTFFSFFMKDTLTRTMISILISVIFCITLTITLVIAANNSLPIYTGDNIISDMPIENLPLKVRSDFANEHAYDQIFINNGSCLICKPGGECNFFKIVGEELCR